MFTGGLQHHAFGGGEAHCRFDRAELQRLQLRLTCGAPVQLAVDRLLQHVERRFGQFFRRHYRIDQADFQRVFGADVFAGGDDFQRAVVTQQAWQADGTAEARHNAQFGFRQADARVR